MNKIFCIAYLLIFLVFSCAYKFPDKTPEWESINSYIPEKLEFQKTSLDEAKVLMPGVTVNNLDANIDLIRTTPENGELFSEINVGFRNKTLDWIEFVLNQKIEMKKIVDSYGLPGTINTDYSKVMDYYNYENFNVSTDKSHQTARSITVFNVSQKQEKKVKTDNLEKTVCLFDKFPNLKPGITTEAGFKNDYPDLLPYMEDDFDVNSCYTLIEELDESQKAYKKAFVKFENGLLSWIGLIPVDNDLQKMLNKINETYKIEKINEDYDFYTFRNFILVVNRQTKKINQIGLINYDKRF